MNSKKISKSGLQSFMTPIAVIGILGLMAFFVWHTIQYMDLIFSQKGSDPGNLYQVISAGLVQAVTICCVVKGVLYFSPRGGGQKKDDDAGVGENPSDG